MAETMKDIIAQLPPGEELFKRALSSIRKRKPFPASRAREPIALWGRVMKLTQNGSTYATAICLKYGFNPDETWRVA